MTAEVLLQIDFLTGELVDNRTRKQKRKARQANGWQQAQMFAQRDLAQFGVRANPEMPSISRNGKPLELVLQMEDPRSAEEQEADRQHAAEKLTDPLFGQSQPSEADSS